eukprot:CAMPEP_0182455444 /NCGR_PEP_ID=MMETSP1319-20130603/1606_1 /TAXON_ID=172717 /ORGANISM="Bolidomonas pacifica, Strain RCC208" /LENGTH=260 /DNA_ID=CAMNT_0024653501 /DNA_START=106 /DNA_END=884 /DNA_ORIENTATION=-
MLRLRRYLHVFALFFALLPSSIISQTPTTAPTPATTAAPTVNVAPTATNNTASADDDLADNSETSATCNMTLYNIWANREFSGLDTEDIIAETNTRWWNIVKYDKDNPFILRNAHAVDVLGTKCRQYMQALKVGISGRHGPVPPQAIYDVMCTDFCTVNDLEREVAMQESGCNCMDLSTKPTEVGYSVPGDWCRENSGRMMCDELEYCGVWECALFDFSCPRMEYNTLNIELRGSPGECGAAFGRFAGVGGLAVVVVAVT